MPGLTRLAAMDNRYEVRGAVAAGSMSEFGQFRAWHLVVTSGEGPLTSSRFPREAGPLGGGLGI